MYGTYNGIKQALASDDIAGIQSIYGAPQFDQFNTGGKRDNTYLTPTNINSFIGSNAQLAVPNLDITTAGDSEWFYVNVPASTTGTMTITVQSSNLSLLSPKLQVYNSSLTLVGQASAVGSMGATISVGAGVQAGQGYYIKVLAAGGPGPIGSYGLLANFGSQTQSPIPPPYTVVPQQPDQGGGTSDDLAPPGGLQSLPGPTSIGTVCGWAETFMDLSNINVAAQTPDGARLNPVRRMCSGLGTFPSRWCPSLRRTRRGPLPGASARPRPRVSLISRSPPARRPQSSKPSTRLSCS